MTDAFDRNPNDAALSLYYFFRGWFFQPDELDLDGFIECFYQRKLPVNCFFNAHQMRHLSNDHSSCEIGSASWFCLVVSWYPLRKEKNILWLHYEDLKADLPKCVRMMADFIGVTLDESLMDIVLHQVCAFYLTNSTRYHLVGEHRLHEKARH